jgi:hypothetical protein
LEQAEGAGIEAVGDLGLGRRVVDQDRDPREVGAEVGAAFLVERGGAAGVGGILPSRSNLVQ